MSVDTHKKRLLQPLCELMLRIQIVEGESDFNRHQYASPNQGSCSNNSRTNGKLGMNSNKGRPMLTT